jgi:HD-like signal output (HDOD) protein
VANRALAVIIRLTIRETNKLGERTLVEDPHFDKKGAELDRQRFSMLEDIARELSSDVVFPTCFETIMVLRKTLQDQADSIGMVADVVALEPLVAARVVALANSVIYSRNGSKARSLPHAIERVGLRNVRMVALSTLMQQLMLSRDAVVFKDMASRLWAHSIHTAAAAFVIARRLSRVNPDEAQLAGLIHDIGGFYMLYRAAHYDELVLRPESAAHLVVQWHESIGYSLISALGLPKEIADAMLDHDQPRALPDPPKTLSDIVYVANRLSGGIAEWIDVTFEDDPIDAVRLTEIGEALGAEITAHSDAMTAVLGQ